MIDKMESERRKKLEALRELGVEVYPTRYDRSHTLAEVVSGYESKSGEELEASPTSLRVAGRIMALRTFGKAGFAHLSDGEGRLQVYVRKDKVKEPGFQIYKKLDIGDFIGVEGTLMRTRTGELTVSVETLTFLAKALRALPEKWHGLSDVEIRYRQRYLDLIANPEAREIFVTRSRMIREIRAFFDERGYIEVETPMLQPIAGGAVARPFKTFHNTLGMDLYMRIAPELYLKRLVVGGLGKVYEINRNFRNEGISTRHNPEFTMLEWYEAFADFESMIAMTEELFFRLAERLKGGSKLTYDGTEIDLSPPFRRVPMLTAIREGLAERRIETTEERLRDRDELRDLLKRLGVEADAGASWGKLVTEAFEEVAEPAIVQPTFVIEFPREVSPLSKQKPGDPELVERFELFIGGLECGNGFSELNDPDEQRARFEDQLKERQRGDAEAHVMDEDYVEALSYGLPPTGGEGVGIDRVAMLFTDSQSIRDVILFPHLRPKAGRKPSDNAPE